MAEVYIKTTNWRDQYLKTRARPRLEAGGHMSIVNVTKTETLLIAHWSHKQEQDQDLLHICLINETENDTDSNTVSN